jgi:hypothetical protein
MIRAENQSNHGARDSDLPRSFAAFDRVCRGRLFRLGFIRPNASVKAFCDQ